MMTKILNRIIYIARIGALAQRLREFINIPLGAGEYTNQIKIVRERYNWDRIAEKTLEVYKKLHSLS